MKQAKSTVSKTPRGAGLLGVPSSAGSSMLGSSALGASHQEAQTPLQRAIEQYLIHLRVERGSSEHTIASYARDLRRYSAYMATLGVIDPERITTAQVRSFMRELAAPTVPLAGFEAGEKNKQNAQEFQEVQEEAAEFAGADDRLRVGARYWKRSCRAAGESRGARKRNANR